MERHHKLVERSVRVLLPGTGGRSVRVASVPTGRALTAACKAYGLRGKVIRRGGSWVFILDRGGRPASLPGTGGRLFLSDERYDALEEQHPGWLQTAGLVAVPTRAGYWVESAQPALLDELRRLAGEALG